MLMRLRRPRRRTLFTGAILLALAFAGIAYSSIPDASGTYTACMLNNVGTLRLIDPAKSSVLGHCEAKLETLITLLGFTH